MYFSVHTLPGDPADLMERKRRFMDPVVAELAPGYGAVWSVTVQHDGGLTTYNLWQTAEGAQAFTAEPAAQEAHAMSGLPMPSQFQAHHEVDVQEYRRTD